MKPYKNLSGISGVVAYQYGNDWLNVQFVDGRIHTYTATGVGPLHLENMKVLADDGEGLWHYISVCVEVKFGHSDLK